MTAAAVGRESGRSALAKAEPGHRNAAGEAGTGVGHIAAEEGLHTAAGRKAAGIAGEGEGLGCSRTAACEEGQRVCHVAWFAEDMLTAGNSLHRRTLGGSCDSLGPGMPC